MEHHLATAPEPVLSIAQREEVKVPHQRDLTVTSSTAVGHSLQTQNPHSKK